MNMYVPILLTSPIQTTGSCLMGKNTALLNLILLNYQLQLAGLMSLGLAEIGLVPIAGIDLSKLQY